MNNTREHSTSSNSKRSRAAFWIFIPIVLVMVVVFVLALQWRASLKVDRFIVEGVQSLSANEVVALADVQPREPSESVNLYTVWQRLKRQPMIKTAVINRCLSNEMNITIVEREPVALLSDCRLQYVDADCVLLNRLSTGVKFDLPLISGIPGLDTAKPGNAIESGELEQALDLIRAGQSVGFLRSISEINMNKGGEIVLYSTESGIPILIGRGDAERKLTTLQTFWKNFVKEDVVHQLQYVDLRFNDQVVVKWDQQKNGQLKKFSL